MKILNNSLAIVIMFSSLVIPALAESSVDVVLNTEDYPPYSYQTSERTPVQGLSVDKVSAMLTKAQLKFELRLFPWKRAYQRALENPNHCVFSTAKTPEREKLFHWIGPIANVEWALLAKEGTAAASVKTIEDAKPFLIGGLEGDASIEDLKARGYNVETVTNNWLNKEKLSNQRIQLWVDDPAYVDHEMKKESFNKKLNYKKVFVLQKSDLYLACNLKMKADVIKKMSVDSKKALK